MLLTRKRSRASQFSPSLGAATITIHWTQTGTASVNVFFFVLLETYNAQSEYSSYGYSTRCLRIGLVWPIIGF